MTQSAIVESVARRPMLAGSVSIALHGSLFAVAAVLASGRVVRSSPPVDLTMIEVIAPAAVVPVAPSQPAPVPRPAVAPAPAVSRGSAERRAAVHSQPRATQVSEAPVEIKVSYDTAESTGTSDAAPSGGLESGVASVAAASRQQLETSLASVQIPAPPAASLARAPRPLHNYHTLRLRDVRSFAGETIKLLLAIDATGRVRSARVLQGVFRPIDDRTVELARGFEFEPARDEHGDPIAGSSRWDILIVEENGVDAALNRGHY